MHFTEHDHAASVCRRAGAERVTFDVPQMAIRQKLSNHQGQVMDARVKVSAATIGSRIFDGRYLVWAGPGRALGRLAVLLVLWLAGAVSSASAGGAADWTGEWDTLWRGGGVRLILNQEGRSVTGTYPLYNGRIEAQSVGSKLEGSWRSDNGEGTFVFVQSRSGDDFSGRYSSGEWWTGARVVDVDQQTQGRFLPQHSPAASLHSFLTTMNATGRGSADLQGRAARLLLPAAETETGVSRIDHARLLFEVMDQLTVRLWDLPLGTDADSVTADLHQAGTHVSLALEFRRIGTRWLIVPPPAAELRNLRNRLRAARAASVQDVSLPDPALASPRDTMRTLITGLAADPANPSAKVLSTLDMSEIGSALRLREGPLLARFLKLTIDRVGYVIWQELPDDPVAETPYVHFQHRVGDIMIAPVASDAGIVWQFTPDTLSNIRGLFAAMDEMPVAPGISADATGDAFFHTRAFVLQMTPFLLQRLGPMELWQWLGLLLMGLIGGILGILFGLGLRWIARKTENKVPALAEGAGMQVMGASLAVGTAILLGDVALAIPDEVGQYTTAGAWLLLIIAASIALGRAINWGAWRLNDGEQVEEHQKVIVDLVRRLVRLLAFIVAGILAAQVLQIPWQGLVAGISIGGLAVALAIQPALINLISGITLYSDKPVKVGDFCSFDETMGTVEHIGLRSTRIRTLDRTLVTIPNSEFAQMQIENYAQRDRIWLQTKLQLRYETTEDQLRYVLVELRKMLIAHPRVTSDPVRVRFVGFGEHSLDIEVFTYVLTPDIAEFHAVREDVFLRMMAIVKAAGAQFAFPSAMHYRAEDNIPDPERVRTAEREVARWRDDDALPFPDFDWREKATLSGTLDYPPRHSVLAETDTGIR